MTTREEAATLTDPDDIIERVLDPERRGDMHGLLHRLREIAPVYKSDHPNMHAGWVITRYDDARPLLGDKRMISDVRAVKMFDDGRGGAFYEIMKRMMLWLDPPDHNRVRGAVSRVFTPRAIAERHARIEEVIHELLDRAADSASLELVEELAYPMPVAVICEVLGIPKEDVALFERWMHAFSRRGDVKALTPELEKEGDEAAKGFEAYFGDLLAERRRTPREDLITKIVQSADETGDITDPELIPACVLLLQAGHGTTADLLGLATVALFEHPGEMARLREEPGLIDSAVEELIRYDTSVTITQRIATTDLTLGNVSLREGEQLVVLNTALNRDPERFHEPDRLDLGRRDNPHLGFGLGNYVCLGASLARAELRTSIGALIQRFPKLALEAEPEYRPAMMLRGLAKLPLRLA